MASHTVSLSLSGTGLMLNQIRSALVVRGAELRLKEGADFTDQAGGNPFDWFESAPASYQGICDEGQPEPGQWCFRPLQVGDKNDTADPGGRVQYQPRQPITIGERQGNGARPLAWVVAVEFTDRNGNGGLDDADLQSGLKLLPVTADHAYEGFENQ